MLESLFNNVAEDIVGEIGYCWIFFGKFVNKLTKLHYRIFVMDLAYRYYKYSKAATETYSKKGVLTFVVAILKKYLLKIIFSKVAGLQ